MKKYYDNEMAEFITDRIDEMLPDVLGLTLDVNNYTTTKTGDGYLLIKFLAESEDVSEDNHLIEIKVRSSSFPKEEEEEFLDPGESIRVGEM